jgi:hypothetical protein
VDSCLLQGGWEQEAGVAFEIGLFAGVGRRMGGL